MKNNIRNLKTDDNVWFTTGQFDSESFLPGEMNIMIFTDDGASIEDADRCIEHFNSLAEKSGVLDAVEEGLEKFFLYMYDEWDEMGIFGKIVESLKPVMQEYRKGAGLTSFLSNPSLIVYPQKSGEVGYGIQCDCPWEPEHQCLILIREDKCVYVGAFEMIDPWSDEEELRCVWED